jgi:hypothetical protein
MRQSLRLAGRLNPWLVAALAALVYGAWAGFVNREYGGDVAFRTFAAQGAYAFVATALVSWVARMALGRGLTRWQAMAAASVVMVGTPLCIHLFNHTPDIFEAMLPGLIIGSIYLHSYCTAQAAN